jgi:selenocysteine-specific elongation factor
MKHLVMGTAGHIDHGKTALIKALTNIDCDTHKEEKKRGITINLGFSHIDLPSGNSVGIIDVPGHKDFINTMVSGAIGIDFVLLVIAADSGIMPQTTEHLNIIKSLGIDKGIVALTKIDLVDDEIAELAQLEIMELFEKMVLPDFQIIPVSSHTGLGIDVLTQTIDNIIPEIKEKNTNGAFRLYIDRLFTIKGIGSIVTGSVLSGKVSIGDDIYLQPEINKKLKVKSIERHGNQVETAFAGDRAALNLSGLKKEDFNRGMLISDKIIDEVEMIDVNISSFENAPELKMWSTILFHAGTFECLAKMHLIDKEVLKSGEEAIAQIHLSRKAILFNKDKFVIRNSSDDKTIAGGYIIDNKPLHHRKRTTKLIENLKLLKSGIENENNLIELIKIELKKDKSAILLSNIAEKINKTEDELISIIEDYTQIILYKTDKQNIIIESSLESIFVNNIIDYLKEYHKQNYLIDSGINANYLYGKFNLSKDKTQKLYIDLLLQKLEKETFIRKYKASWILPNHKPEINEKTQENINWLENKLLSYSLQLAVLKDIEDEAKQKGIAVDELRMYYKYLTDNNILKQFKADYIHTNLYNKVKDKTIAELKNNTNGINLSEFRELVSSTKKIIPLLISLMLEEKIITSRKEGTHTIISLV